MTTNETRDTVRAHYDRVAKGETAECAPGCCGAVPGNSLALGYSADELESVPEGANMGLGCGNPRGIASLAAGETVLDLGSGGGFDCLLAAKQVGPTGRVIGVDMTASMIAKARKNAEEVAANNVEFRLGEIEHLPLADGTVNVVISNCVLNLSPEKDKVYREIFRVLEPGGRVAISDVVATAPIPEALVERAAALSGCVSQAAPVDEVRRLLVDAGFQDVEVTVDEGARSIVAGWLPGSGAEKYVAPASIRATKPKGDCCAPECCA